VSRHRGAPNEPKRGGRLLGARGRLRRRGAAARADLRVPFHDGRRGAAALTGTAEDAVAAGYGVLAEGVDGADVGGEDEEGETRVVSRSLTVGRADQGELPLPFMSPASEARGSRSPYRRRAISAHRTTRRAGTEPETRRSST